MTTPIIATTGPVVTPVVRWPDAYGFQFVYDGTFAVQAYRTAQERDTGMAFQLDHGRTVRPFLIPGESEPPAILPTERELLETLYKAHPELRDDPSEFTGYYADWNEVIDACNDGTAIVSYSESPLELIWQIQNDRDDAKAALETLRNAVSEQQYTLASLGWNEATKTNPAWSKAGARRSQYDAVELALKRANTILDNEPERTADEQTEARASADHERRRYESTSHPHAELMRRAANHMEGYCSCATTVCHPIIAELRAAAGEGSTQ